MTQIFWGYLFVLFHVRINGFDLLPDILGYILLCVGLTKLLEESSHFKHARPFGVFLAIWSALIAVGRFGAMDFEGALFTAFNIATVAIWIYLTYLIVLGVKDLEANTGAGLYFHPLFTIWKIQAALQVIVRIAPLTQSQMMVNISVLFVALLIALNVVFLVYFYKAKTKYALVGNENDVEPEENAASQKPISKAVLILLALVALVALTAVLWSRGVFYIIDRQTSPNGNRTVTVYSQDVSDTFPTDTGVTFKDSGEFRGTQVYQNAEYINMWWSPCSNYTVKSLIFDGEPYLELNSFQKNTATNLALYLNMNLAAHETFAELMADEKYRATLAFDFVAWQDTEGTLTVRFVFTDDTGEEQKGTLDFNVQSGAISNVAFETALSS